jgi:hypothetical protein
MAVASATSPNLLIHSTHEIQEQPCGYWQVSWLDILLNARSLVTNLFKLDQ